jgi:thiol-disulfide isomerase/thioredoxin
MLARAFALIAFALGIACLPGCDAQSSNPTHPLVGHAAPPFSATTLDGAPFELADYLGKDVIILDFWATWCGPCRQSLPALAEVAAQYKERGVAFFAVDVEETPDEVRAFLAEAMLDLPVVMDPDGAISSLYKLKYFPQTVIIGKDGKVAFVHEGIPPRIADLKAEWMSQLDQLLAVDKRG